MRSSLILGLACLVASTLACGSEEGPVAPPSGEMAAKSHEEPATPPLRPKAVRAVGLPTQPERVDPDAVLFLPFVNRSSHRIHPSYLHAFERTLAAHAAAYLGRRPVRPEIAMRLAPEVGVPVTPWTLRSDAKPAPEALARATRLVGAGAVVWGEIREDRSIALYASAYAPAADTSPWDGFVLSNEGPIDLALYDGPRRLLAGLVAAGRVPPVSGGSDPAPEARKRFAAALELEALGHPTSLRRAELALADLAVEHPGWSEPWARLAFLRVLRGWLRNASGADARFLGEGPNPARHIARLFPDLADDDRARLDVVDHMFLLHLQTPEELTALLQRVPADASRVLLAHRHFERARESFGLDLVAPRTPFEKSFLTIAASHGTADFMARATARAEETEPWEQIQDPYLASEMRQVMEERGDWTGEYRWTRTWVPAYTLGALEVLRAGCAELSRGRDACAEPLREFAALYLAEEEARALDPAALEDWDTHSSRLSAAVLGADAVQDHPEALPNRQVFRDDATFASQWLLVSQLLSAANRSLKAYDSAATGSVTRRAPLVADTRNLLRNHLSWLLETAYQPVMIARRRTQRDEGEPYLEVLEPFSRGFPVAHRAELQSRSSFGMKAHYFQGWGALAKGDLFDGRWVSQWLDAAYRNKGAEMSRSNVNVLASVVPGTHTMTLYTAEAWWKAGDVARAIDVMNAGMASMSDPRVANYLDRAMFAANRPRAERIATLERSIDTFPFQNSLRSRLGYAYLWSGRTERAEPIFRSLLDDPVYFEDACSGIGHILGYRGDAAAVEDHFRDCLQRAPDRWKVVKTYRNLAGFAIWRGDYEEAYRSLEEARKRVGGAGYVLIGLGVAHELAGDSEAAESWYRRHNESYPRSTDGAIQLARLHLRNGRVDRAREAVLAADPDPANDWGLYDLLGRIHLREGNIEGFAALCRKAQGKAAFNALGDLYSYLDDHENEIALGKEGSAAYPDDRRFVNRQGRALVDLGRFEEGRAILEPLFEDHRSDNWYRLHLVRALIGVGDLARARALTDEWTRTDPFSRDGVEMRYRVHRAAGDLARARADLAKASSWAPPSGFDAHRNWWSWQRRWVLLEAELGLEALRPGALVALTQRVERILHHLPNDLELWPLLAKLKVLQGDEAGATAARAMAARLDPVRNAKQVAAR